jgi:hypothetical protein
MMPMPMFNRRRLQIDLRRHPAAQALQPAAEQRDGRQETDAAQLPPEVRHDDDLETRKFAGSDARPDERRHDEQQNRRRPTSPRQHRPRFRPVDAPETPGDESEEKGMSAAQLHYFHQQLGQDFDELYQCVAEVRHGCSLSIYSPKQDIFSGAP